MTDEAHSKEIMGSNFTAKFSRELPGRATLTYKDEVMELTATVCCKNGAVEHEDAVCSECEHFEVVGRQLKHLVAYLRHRFDSHDEFRALLDDKHGEDKILGEALAGLEE